MIRDRVTHRVRILVVACLASALAGCPDSGGRATPEPAQPVVTPGPSEPHAPVAALDPNACCKDATCDKDAFRRAGGACPGDFENEHPIPEIVGGGIDERSPRQK